MVSPSRKERSELKRRSDNLDMDMVYPRLYQSSLTAARNLDNIIMNGITHVLVVTPHATPAFPDRCDYMIIDEIEDDQQNIMKWLPKAVKFIQDALKENKTNNVLVHCAAGKARSAAFCCAYMLHDMKRPVEDVIKVGSKNRQKFAPNSNFVQ